MRTGAMELGKVRCLPQRAASSMLCPADKKQVRIGAMELARCLPWRAASSMLWPADKKRLRTGAVELGKMLTPESRLLHVVPGGQEAGENSL